MRWLVAVCLLLSGFAPQARLAAQVGSPAGPVPPELLARRRAALFQRLSTGIAIVRSAAARSIEGEYPQDSDFRQDNDFFYLTGLETPESWLVLVSRADGAREVRLYLPARDAAAERWTGPQLGPGAEAAQISGIVDTRPSERAAAELEELIHQATSPARSGGLWLDEPFGAKTECPGAGTEHSACVARLVVPASISSAITIKPLNPVLAALRLVKDEDEVRRLRRAIEITTDAHRDAMAAIEPGMWEYEIEAIIEFGFRRRGAERVGFPSIVGAGPNSTILHYDKSRRRTQAGELVVIDVGAEFGYYTADVTRTVPISGRFTPRQRALYDLVLASQQAAMDAARPGLSMPELNAIAREYMRRHSADLCAPASCDKYFVHGLSHWLGMDVHDVGSFGARFVPGMVLTIEPGIYLPAENIGIRIEDDILITPTGYELLSRGAPRAAAEIETLMIKRKVTS